MRGLSINVANNRALCGHFVLAQSQSQSLHQVEWMALNNLAETKNAKALICQEDEPGHLRNRAEVAPG